MKRKFVSQHINNTLYNWLIEPKKMKKKKKWEKLSLLQHKEIVSIDFHYISFWQQLFRRSFFCTKLNWFNSVWSEIVWWFLWFPLIVCEKNKKKYEFLKKSYRSLTIKIFSIVSFFYRILSTVSLTQNWKFTSNHSRMLTEKKWKSMRNTIHIEK